MAKYPQKIQDKLIELVEWFRAEKDIAKFNWDDCTNNEIAQVIDAWEHVNKKIDEEEQGEK